MYETGASSVIECCVLPRGRHSYAAPTQSTRLSCAGATRWTTHLCSEVQVGIACMHRILQHIESGVLLNDRLGWWKLWASC